MGKVTGTTLTVAKEISTEHVSTITSFFRRKGAYDSLPDYCNSKDLYSHLIRTLIKPDLVLRGRLTCLLTVKPTFANIFGALHGGAIAAVAEMVSIACARTVVAEDKDIFLGELGRGDCRLLCSEEWKKFDCGCNGVQAQENWAVSLYCSHYIL